MGLDWQLGQMSIYKWAVASLSLISSSSVYSDSGYIINGSKSICDMYISILTR